MTDVDDLVGKNIDDLRQVLNAFGRREISPLEMSMPVKMIAGFCHTQEPVNGFDALVSLGLFVVDAKRRGVGDQDIQRAAKVETVQKQAGHQAKGPGIGLHLRILIGSVRAVADGTAKTADQKFLKAHHLEVQVCSAFDTGKVAIGVIGWVMIARHVK